MFTLIIGGSASGKSDFAQRHVLSLDGPRIYVATMEPFGSEAAARIARHLALRNHLNFRTIECCVNLFTAPVPPLGNVLLEDLGNLTANEMFRPDGGGPEAVLEGVASLRRRSSHLTIVTNEVFSDGRDYAGETLVYLRALAQLNRVLAREADQVVEVVCGLPNVLKEAGA